MSQYLTFENVAYIMLEPTSRCNLACPQCSRVLDGKLNPDLPQIELSQDQVEHIFGDGIGPRLREVYCSGNFGDPSTFSHLHWMIRYLRKQGLPKFYFSTNGSLHSPDWWAELGRLMNQPEDMIQFSIDGLEETNAIYRVNSNFEKIMRNVRTFIQAGGRAQWDFLVFSHNEHEVDEARERARREGFVAFNLKRTGRFLDEDTFEQGYIHNKKVPLLDKKKSLPLVLNAPSSSQRTDQDHQLEKIKSQFSNWGSYLNDTEISCKFQAYQGVFIDFTGDLWPCTWLGAGKYLELGRSDQQREQTDALYAQYGNGFNNVLSSSVRAVLQHPWYSEGLHSSWQHESQRTSQRLRVCARTCGSILDYTSGPWGKNSKLINFSNDPTLESN